MWLCTTRESAHLRYYYRHSSTIPQLLEVMLHLAIIVVSQHGKVVLAETTRTSTDGVLISIGSHDEREHNSTSVLMLSVILVCYYMPCSTPQRFHFPIWKMKIMSHALPTKTLRSNQRTIEEFVIVLVVDLSPTVALVAAYP